MARKAKDSKFSWKRVGMLVAAGLLLLGVLSGAGYGAKYWWEGHPHFKVGECLRVDGFYFRITDNKNGKYTVLAALPGIPFPVPMESPIRLFNSHEKEMTRVSCDTGEDLPKEDQK